MPCVCTTGGPNPVGQRGHRHDHQVAAEVDMQHRTRRWPDPPDQAGAAMPENPVSGNIFRVGNNLSGTPPQSVGITG